MNIFYELLKEVGIEGASQNVEVEVEELNHHEISSLSSSLFRSMRIGYLFVVPMEMVRAILRFQIQSA